jgi:hypothetical protein
LSNRIQVKIRPFIKEDQGIIRQLILEGLSEHIDWFEAMSLYEKFGFGQYASDEESIHMIREL